MREILSENLKKYRTAAGLTQEQAAERLCVSAQTVSRWECGNSLPDAVILPEVARLYGVTIDDLFRKSSVAYENYAQRLAAVYESSQKPEDFLRAVLEFQKQMDSGTFTPNDMCIYAAIHRYMMNDCREKALYWFRRAAEESRETDSEAYHRARLQQMTLRMDLGETEQVLTEQTQRVRERPDRSEWNMLVAAYSMAGQQEQAYDCFQKAVARFPEDWELYVYGGDICSRLKRYDEAFACWDKAIALRPDAPDAKYCKAFCCQELGDQETARRLFLEIANDLERAGYDVEAAAERRRAEQMADKSFKTG